MELLRISSVFGFRDNPFIAGKLVFHPGVDLVADTGDPVIATADGVVEEADPNNEIYGTGVVILSNIDSTLKKDMRI